MYSLHWYLIGKSEIIPRKDYWRYMFPPVEIQVSAGKKITNKTRWVQHIEKWDSCLETDIFVMKCHESSAKVKWESMGAAIWPYWQYIENLWHDFQNWKGAIFCQFLVIHTLTSSALSTVERGLTSLDLNWLFIKSRRSWLFDHFSDLSKRNYCLHDKYLMFFCDCSLTAPSIFWGRKKMTIFLWQQICVTFLFHSLMEWWNFIFTFLKIQRLSYKVFYLESSLWKCFERFCEWLQG